MEHVPLGEGASHFPKFIPFTIIITTTTMDNDNLDGTKRSHIQIDQWVEIVEKRNQASGETTEGQVRRILTKSGQHPHGIKVMLKTGEVGRVKEILED